jgi:NAD(P)H-hydrate epimerase
MTAAGERRTPLPEGVERIDDATVASLVPARDEAGHKGTFGTLVAVCGSLDFLGAALLAGTASLRAGVGIAVLAVPASLQPLAAGRVPELVTLALPETAPHQVDPVAAVAAIEGRAHTALLVGPGLRPGTATSELVARLVAGPGTDIASAAVVDAEALNVLAGRRRWWGTVGRPVVLTPHPGEFARLDGSPVGAGDQERADRARDAARRWRQVVVLKGARTVVAEPSGACAMSESSNPALATGGTGDVLSGIAASLLAQGSTPWDAARLAVHLHATAGEHVRERLGDAGLLASDLLGEIPRVRRHLVRLAERSTPASRRMGFAHPATDA